MIDVDAETMVLFAEGRRRLPGSPSRVQLERWSRLGVLVRETGLRVKLDAIRIGPAWYTSLEAFKRFVHEVNQNT